MVDRSAFHAPVLLCAITFASIVLLQPAFAATHDQIVEMCRQRMHPQVQACAQAKGLRGNPEAVRQQCGIPFVRPCVMREEQKQAAGVAAPAAPKDETAVAPKDAAFVQPVFVAPPRTIADITAILDSEKPDEAKIAERKAKADATPPNNESAAKLAQFYYDRGNARALLARNKEALADGLQALAVGKSGIDYRLLSHIQQFVALQYRPLAIRNRRSPLLDSMVREGNQPGSPGHHDHRVDQHSAGY